MWHTTLSTAVFLYTLGTVSNLLNDSSTSLVILELIISSLEDPYTSIGGFFTLTLNISIVSASLKSF